MSEQVNQDGLKVMAAISRVIDSKVDGYRNRRREQASVDDADGVMFWAGAESAASAMRDIVNGAINAYIEGLGSED